MNIIGTYLSLILMEKMGLVHIAETYTTSGAIRIYRQADGRYLSTTTHIIRQTDMDGDALARYLCHMAMDSKCDTFKLMMQGEEV